MNKEKKLIRPSWRSFYLEFSYLFVAVGATGWFMYRQYIGLDNPLVSTAMMVVLTGMGMFFFVRILYRRYSRRYYLDELGIKEYRGIIAKRGPSIDYAKLMSAKGDQCAIERLMRFGDVLLFSAGTAEAEIKIEGVLKPYALRDEIDQLSHNAKVGGLT